MSAWSGDTRRDGLVVASPARHRFSVRRGRVVVRYCPVCDGAMRSARAARAVGDVVWPLAPADDPEARMSANHTHTLARHHRLDRAIVAELRGHGGAHGSIADHGPDTGWRVRVLERRGWLVRRDGGWALTVRAEEARAGA